MTTKKKVGKRIAAARERAKMSQVQVAEHIGVSYQAVSRWELGETSPRNSDTYRQLAQLFGTTPEYLLYGAENNASLAAISGVGTIVASVDSDDIDHGVEPAARRLKVH